MTGSSYTKIVVLYLVTRNNFETSMSTSSCFGDDAQQLLVNRTVLFSRTDWHRKQNMIETGRKLPSPTQCTIFCTVNCIYKLSIGRKGPRTLSSRHLQITAQVEN